MGRGKKARHFFPLRGFQIGDLQSYLSDLTLFLGPESKTFYVLVDNRPWLEDLVSGPAHLWQLMITKYRFSPFAITRGQKEIKEDPKFNDHSKRSSKSQRLKRWLSMVTLSRKRVLLPVKKLSTSLLANSKLQRTLYGFIVFEVAWNNVRGINYLNLLQTSTSLAIEATYMNRWEFDSIDQASTSIFSWFPGTLYERTLLDQHLNSMIGEAFHEAGTDSLSTCSSTDDEKTSNNDMLSDIGFLYSPNSNHSNQSETLEIVDQKSQQNSPVYQKTQPNSPVDQIDPPNSPVGQIRDYDFLSDYNSEISLTETGSYHTQSPCQSESAESTEATQYTDVLLLFRFNDRDLPFELQKVIMSDLRLLRLLEAGLPSWVLFFQSYPVFCHMYRPWMCPLARGLYVGISFVTVIIGFYDLYKNVPVLKATASRLFGPLFDWIETWEMVSRIKYLGTMLFLHNAEKAVMWFLMVSRTFRSLVSILTQPLVVPFMLILDVILPFWNVFVEKGGQLYTLICLLMGTCWNLVDQVIDGLMLPVWYIASVIVNFATGVMGPILLCIWGALYAPIRLLVGLANFVVVIYKYMFDLVKGIWPFVSSIIKVASKAEAATARTCEVSMWRALWNDLFSKVFRAVKSILYGVVAFFTACNRHRLSIYNHLLEFIRRLHQPQSAQRSEPLNTNNNRLYKYGPKTPPSESRERRQLATKSTKQN